MSFGPYTNSIGPIRRNSDSPLNEHDERLHRLTGCPPARSPHFHGETIDLDRPCDDRNCDLSTAVYAVSHDLAVRAGLVGHEGEQRRQP